MTCNNGTWIGNGNEEMFLFIANMDLDDSCKDGTKITTGEGYLISCRLLSLYGVRYKQ